MLEGSIVFVDPIYGYRDVTTPAIDAPAADGIVFEQARAHSPMTLPSHASMLTGLLPFEHGVRDNMGFALGAGTPTLASLLRGRGYSTAGLISAYVPRRDTGIAQGFAAYDDALPATSPEKATGEVQRDGSQTLAAAQAWLAGRTDKKWFLFLHLYEPHSPYEPPERFRRFADAYDGEIAYADEIVGNLLGTLKQRGDYDRALIVLLSDHGEGLGDHGEMEHGIFLYSETTNVPLVVNLPGGREAARRVAQPVQHIDLLPTLLEEIGAPVPATFLSLCGGQNEGFHKIGCMNRGKDSGAVLLGKKGESGFELQCGKPLFSELLRRMFGRGGRVQFDGGIEAVEIRRAIGAFGQMPLEFTALGGRELRVELLADVVQHIGTVYDFLLHAVM